MLQFQEVKNKNSHPLYKTIYTQIKAEILSGGLALHEKLPPTRKLASNLGISRNTVELAYQQLVSEGYISVRQGSAYEVAVTGHELWPHETDQNLLPYPAPASHTAMYDLWYPLIDSYSFPDPAWRRAIVNALNSLPGSHENSYYPAHTGDSAIRETLSTYLNRNFDVKCDPQQITLSCGFQINLEILLKLFDSTKDYVAMENPGYYGARQVFERNRFRVIPIPVDKRGISVEYLSNIHAKILYTTPAHQFPTGAYLTADRRIKLLEWAQENNAYIIEDAYDNELQYDFQIMTSLQSLDQDGRVIYAGTFSKSLSPGLRVSYFVLPNRIIQRYHQNCGIYLSQVPTVTQLALASYIQNGDLYKHLRKMRLIYSEKHKILCNSLKETFGSSFVLFPCNGGTYVLTKYNTDLTNDNLIQSAAQNNIAVYSDKECWINQNDAPVHQLLLGFGSIKTADIPMIVKTLHNVW